MRILQLFLYWGDFSVAKDLEKAVREVCIFSHLQEEGIVRRLQTA